MRRTKEEAEKTRLTILKEAAGLFYKNGVVRTSLQDIAKGAGVTRGAVYWHFRDKVDLLRALADDAFLPHEDLLARMAAAEHGDPLEALKANCCATLDALANDPVRRRLLTVLTRQCEYMEEMEALSQRNNACRDRIRARLTAILEQALKKKMLAPVWTPASAALALHSLLTGFVHGEMDYAHPSRARDKARSEVISAFFRTLRKCDKGQAAS